MDFYLRVAERKKTDEPIGINSDETNILNSSLYNNSTSGDFDFPKVEIVGDSLRLTINYGGGCGDIKFKLVDSGAVMESNPVQRNIRLIFNDKDDCEALLTKVISFDLTPIKLNDQNSILINLTNWNSQLLSEY